MSKHPLLVENESKRLELPLPMLVCVAMFPVWQMGVLFFSGEALTIGGRTPFPVNMDNQIALIAAAYILSIVFLIFFQRYCVMAGKDRLRRGVAVHPCPLCTVCARNPDRLLLHSGFLLCFPDRGRYCNLRQYVYGKNRNIVSLYVPVFSLAACALLGAGLAVCYLTSYFGIVMAKRYPSRFIMPVIIVIALITIIVHSTILEVFRDNLQILYIIYLVVSVAMAILYLMLEPYLLYSFRGRTLQDIIGVVAEDKDDDELVKPETVSVAAHAQARPPLLRTAPKAEPVPPKEEPLHERRMKALMSRAPEPLTRREYQAADGIMRGLRRSEIAKEMQILPESVTKYINRIYDKFGIHRRQDLFKLAETLDREWMQ
jgi:DNA-binding CsgD family transcriptional regulator